MPASFMLLHRSWRSSRLLLLALWFIASPCSQAQDPEAENDLPTVRLEVPLSHTKTRLHLYEPEVEPPRAVIIFGSGDGGWSPWEDSVSLWLQNSGVYVAGFDLAHYAEHDYDAATLGSDMAKIASTIATRLPDGQKIPIIYGGWSMGAVQAVAAAASSQRPAQLKGLLLLSADSRGRYGLRESDELGITPKGPGTFALSEFSAAMRDLRVAQFHGGADFMASSAWVQTLKSPHALYLVPGANHGFDGPDDSFEEWLLRGTNWVLGDDSAASPPEQATLPFGLSPLWPAALLSVLLTLFFIFSKKHSLRVLALAVMVMGLATVIEAFTSKPSSVLAWMSQWEPLGISEKSRLPLLMAGLALLVLARGLSRRKNVAWWFAVVMLSLSAVLHLSRSFDWHHALAGIVLLVPLIRWRREFIARSDASSFRFAWRMALLVAVSLFLYGAFGLWQYNEAGELGEPLTWSQCMNGSASALLIQKSSLDRQGSRSARAFLHNLRGGSLLGALAVLGLMLRPVLEHQHPEATEEERDTVKRLIAAHGRDPMDSFALLSDKRYHFNADRSGVIAFALWRNYAVALAGPISAEHQAAVLIDDFITFCRIQDWIPVFYCTPLALRPVLDARRLTTVKIGEDARLNMAEFKLQGGKFQNLRTARNKAQKNGLTFEWYQPNPAPDHGIEAQLHVLSDQWLANKHGGEMTFDLGAFDLAAIREHGVSIVRNPEGRLEAFATWWPYAKGAGRCLDLMRAREDVRDVMDFLIVESLDHFKAIGVEEASLGNAPLANLETESGTSPVNRQERAIQFIFENFDKFYGYKSLFNFKKKYQPEWQGRFLAYPADANLAVVGLAIAGVHLPGGFMGLLKS